VAKINESDLRVDLVNNSSIALRGADNFDSLRGVGLDGLVMDEFAYIDEAAWTEVLRPTLSDRQGWAMFISTPAGVGNWAFDLYQRGQDPGEHQWESWQFNTLSGGRVPEFEIEAARRDLDTRTFRQEYEAAFETFSGVIYYNFSRSDNLQAWSGEIPAQLYLFCDFNVSPMSAIVVAPTSIGLHAIDEIVIYGSNTNELVEEVRNRLGDRKITAFPDPAGAQRRTSAGGRTDITILQQAGFAVKYRNAHPPVRDRINSVNSLLCSSTGDRRLVIDPRCRRLIESLEKHCYKENTQIPDKDSGWDHMTDALGYGVEYLFPIRKETQPQPMVPWGMATRPVPTR
jgi:hypothetical protein